MKGYLLRRLAFMVFVAMGTLGVLGQTVVRVNTTPITDLNSAPLNTPPFQWDASMRSIVPVSPVPSISLDKTTRQTSTADSRGKFNIWLEHGDGGFTMQDTTTRTMGNVKYPIFFRAIPLYDTSKGKDLTITRSLLLNKFPDGEARLGDNDVPLLTAKQQIKITPSNKGIVPQEPLTMAITYKFPIATTDIVNAQYYAILYYNNTGVFETLSTEGKSSFLYSPPSSNQIEDIRLFDNFQAVAKTAPTIPNDMLPSAGLGSFAVGLLGRPQPNGSGERNFFVTLKTKAAVTGLTEGQSTAITVLFVSVIDGVVKEIGRHTINNELRLTSFDPNHLTQSPKCLLLPKKAQPLQFRLQFQNLGKGPADTIKLVFQRPAGLAGAAFTQGAFNYGGKTLPTDAALFTYSHNYDAASNTDIFLLSSTLYSPKHTLKGTTQVADALNNPETMGEVNFTLMAPESVGDSIQSHANIYFHSQFSPDLAFTNGRWEQPIKTNIETTVYRKKACECDNTCIGGCYIIFGLCWWWWALILLVLLLLIWLLRRKK